MVNLFQLLPNELHTLILCELDFQDVLSLRLASRSLYEIVCSCESALVRHYTKHICTGLETFLYPPPGPNEASLQYLLDWKHRRNTSQTLSGQLCNFVAREILFRNTVKKRRNFEPTWRRMFIKLQPLIFTLNHFFESYRRSLLERCVEYSDPSQTFQICNGPALWDDQMQIMETYDPILLLDLYHCYGFLLQAFERKLRPPSYATGFERLLRGWTAKPATTHEIEILLMIGGMDKISHILSYRTYSERRKALDTFIRGLYPSLNPHGWRQHWRQLGIDKRIPLDQIPHTQLGIPTLHVIWVPNALNLLLAKGVIEHVEFGGESSVWSLRDFVSDMVGWDILRYSAPPPSMQQQSGSQDLDGAEDDESEEDESESELEDEEDDVGMEV